MYMKEMKETEVGEHIERDEDKNRCDICIAPIPIAMIQTNKFSKVCQ